MIRLIFASLALALLPGADWPQWRGPNRDGIALGAELPVAWAAAAPAPKWTAEVGTGYSGPAVAGGRVYIMGRMKEDERCLCFDAATGKELWKVEYPEPFRAPDPTAGRGPNSTPTVDGDRIYAFGLGGRFHCLDAASGKIHWKHDCKKEYWGVKKGLLGDDSWFPPCGAAASPLVDGNTVVVPVGGKKAGAFTAFDRTTGAIVWKALDDRSSYASPIVAAPAGVKQFVGFTGTRMVGLRYADRELLWEFPFATRFEQTVVTPVVWQDLAIVGGDGKPTSAVRLKESRGQVSKEIAWKSDDLKMYLTSPVTFADHLLGFDVRTNRLICLNLDDGEVAWTSPRVPGRYHSLVVASSSVMVLNSEGELLVLKASPEKYAELAKWRVAENGTWAHLAVAGNRIYVKDNYRLYCYELGR